MNSIDRRGRLSSKRRRKQSLRWATADGNGRRGIPRVRGTPYNGKRHKATPAGWKPAPRKEDKCDPVG